MCDYPHTSSTLTARLLLEATLPGTLIQGPLGSNLLRVTLGSRVQLHCSGSGNLNWAVQSGETIEVNTDIDPDVNRHQQFDFSDSVQQLIIQVFSEADSDLYTCTSDLLVNGIEGVITMSVFITSGMFVYLFTCMFVCSLMYLQWYKLKEYDSIFFVP